MAQRLLVASVEGFVTATASGVVRSAADPEVVFNLCLILKSYLIESYLRYNKHCFQLHLCVCVYTHNYMFHDPLA
jgi:hypothetical protein